MGRRPAGSSKSEICLWFNGQAGCRFTKPACRFKHMCQSCRKPGHRKFTCSGNWVWVFGQETQILIPQSLDSLMATDWTVSARKLACLSKDELKHPVIHQTLSQKPDLFQIITPIRVDKLAKQLHHHSNHDFVESVLVGLWEGFWLWATMLKEGYPLTHDESWLLILTLEKKAFLHTQLEHEQKLGRVSHSFGDKLLPGMFCMPNYVPKPHNDQVIGDLSTIWALGLIHWTAWLTGSTSLVTCSTISNTWESWSFESIGKNLMESLLYGNLTSQKLTERV